MNLRTVLLASLHGDPANANEHSEEDIVELMAKLAAFEQVEPLVVQASTMKVIGGNGRLEAMRRLGWAEADVNLVDVDNVTATAMAIALNRKKSRMNEEIVARQLQALQSEGWEDFQAVGFDDVELEAILGRDVGGHEDGETGQSEASGPDLAAAVLGGEWPEYGEPESHSFVLRYRKDDIPSLVKFLDASDDSILVRGKAGEKVLERIREITSD